MHGISRSVSSVPMETAPPWPEGHVPATDGERRMWMAFAELRADSNSQLSLLGVARKVGMSRTSISMDNSRFKVLRTAILEEMNQRRQAKLGIKAETLDAGRPKLGVRHWQAVAQRADSLLAEYKVAALQADERSRRSRELLDRIFQDIRAGRWRSVDQDAVTMADLAVELRFPSKAADQLDSVQVQQGATG